MLHKCACGFEGYCYGLPSSAGEFDLKCPRCGCVDKLTASVNEPKLLRNSIEKNRKKIVETFKKEIMTEQQREAARDWFMAECYDVSAPQKSEDMAKIILKALETPQSETVTISEAYSKLKNDKVSMLLLFPILESMAENMPNGLRIVKEKNNG